MSLPLLHAGRTNPGLSAALDLRFALDKSLTAYRGPTPSFSRASTGSYFDGSGVLRYANVNTILYSEQFENAYWFKSGLSISADSTVAPDGKTTADKVVENASSGIKYGTIAGGFPVVSGTTYTFSAYAKDSGRYFGFATNSTAFPNAIGAVFNLANGTISNIQANTTASIQSVGNGWYRCIITGTASASTTTNINFGISNDLNQIYPSYTGNGSSGYFLWGFQMETGSTVGTYCPTTTSANSAPRFNHTYNGTSWVSRGLLVEEQRTNIITYSEQFNNTAWTANGLNADVSTNLITAPDGAQTADKLFETNVNGGHYLNQTASITTGNSYTSTIYVKKENRSWLQIAYNSAAFGVNAWANFDVNNGVVGNKGSSATANITSVGSGWYRCSITATSTATATSGPVICLLDTDVNSRLPSYLGDGSSGLYIWGAQLELGAFPTSYIPTTSASTTRSADVCQITGGDFSGFWNGTEGTLAVEADVIGNDGSNGNQVIVNIGNGTSSNRVDLIRNILNLGGEFGAYVRSSSVEQALLATSANAWPVNLTEKAAFAFKANDFSMSYNGASPSVDTSGNIPSSNMMVLGNFSFLNSYLNGHIARLRYFNKRLPNATLQQLSDPDPTLNLQFALNKSLTPVAGPAPSFSRASTGTFFNASGILTSASINTPRFDHVYSGGQWVSRGLLVEEQRTNILMYSEDISYGGWTKTDASVSVNSGIAPDGNMTADKLVENTASSVAHRMYYPLSMGTSSTFSAFFKAAGRNYVMMMIYPGTAKFAYFDILNGSVVSTNAPEITAKVQPVGNGWFRCSVTYSGAFSSSFVQIHMSPDGITDTYNGDGTSGMFIWGLQAENNVLFPTSYIPTTTTSVTRSADVCQITGTSFGWMWNQGEGSFVAEYDRLFSASSISNASTVFQAFIDGSNNDRYALFHNSSGTVGERFNVTVGNVEYANLDSGVSVSQLIGRASSAYKLNDFALTVNGGSIVSDTSGLVVSNADKLNIGRMYSSNWLNGHIAKLVYYPARLTNTKLQQLST